LLSFYNLKAMKEDQESSAQKPGQVTPTGEEQKGEKQDAPAPTGHQPDPFQPQGPRDGYDNTGTQGYDSLKDDGYTGSSAKDTDTETQDGTGSSSKDFPGSHDADE
jgi:hypothetical protein